MRVNCHITVNTNDRPVKLINNMQVKLSLSRRSGDEGIGGVEVQLNLHLGSAADSECSVSRRGSFKPGKQPSLGF
jgi:hypothetical protein